ncbi:MAG: potassium transporter TrkG [Clostridia bacterium]
MHRRAAGEGKPLAQHSIRPERVLALGFLVLIALGGFLLSLPISANSGRSLGALRSFFTATSAVCVTGLSIVDVGRELSGFGQIVLLSLIQMGGLGFMVFATLFMVALGKRISLRNRMLIRESMNQSKLSGMVRFTLWLFLLALGIECAGALLLMTRFIPLYGVKQGLWFGVFHSVSAFCNAGFDLFGGYQSLTGFSADPMVLLTLAGLIILGGLGFTVLPECLHFRFRIRKLSLHTKLVLTMTGILLSTGTLLILALEWGNQGTLGAEGFSFWQKLSNSFFQAVTFRTAGFASLEQAALTDSSKLLGIVSMFIGASSASTGGGVKTTTFCMVVLMAAAVVRGHEQINAFGREISAEIARRAITIVIISMGVILLFTCALSIAEQASGVPMLDLLFEAASAFSTTGLSAANTPELSIPAQCLLMPLMFFGRVGPLTLAFALAGRAENRLLNRIRFPNEKIMIG